MGSRPRLASASETGDAWRRVEGRIAQGRIGATPDHVRVGGYGRRSPGVASRSNDARLTGRRRPIRGGARHEGCGIPGTSAVDFDRAWRRWLQPELAVLRRRRSDTPAPPPTSDSITQAEVWRISGEERIIHPDARLVARRGGRRIQPTSAHRSRTPDHPLLRAKPAGCDERRQDQRAADRRGPSFHRRRAARWRRWPLPPRSRTREALLDVHEGCATKASIATMTGRFGKRA